MSGRACGSALFLENQGRTRRSALRIWTILSYRYGAGGALFSFVPEIEPTFRRHVAASVKVHHVAGPAACSFVKREGEAPAEPRLSIEIRLGRSLALPNPEVNAECLFFRGFRNSDEPIEIHGYEPHARVHLLDGCCRARDMM